MLNNNWIAQQLVHDHQQQLRQKADQARQVQDAQRTINVHRHRRKTAKLRAEMTIV